MPRAPREVVLRIGKIRPQANGGLEVGNGLALTFGELRERGAKVVLGIGIVGAICMAASNSAVASEESPALRSAMPRLKWDSAETPARLSDEP